MSTPTDDTRRLLEKLNQAHMFACDIGSSGIEPYKLAMIGEAIREARAALEAAAVTPDDTRLRELLIRADSYLSLLWHRYVPPDRKNFELQVDVEQTIADLRKCLPSGVTKQIAEAASEVKP